MTDEASSATRRNFCCVLYLSLFALASCAQPARETFDLAGPLGAARIAPSRPGPPLAVLEPAAATPTSSDRVVVRDADGGVAVLPGVQWSERLPRLFQDRLIESLQRAGVSASRFNAAAASSLAIDIRRFEIDIARSVAVVEIAARIVNESSGVARAAKVFLAETPAPERIGAPAVHALSSASAEAAARIAAWTRAQL
jgi:cholesterol transport system auxiliary component